MANPNKTVATYRKANPFPPKPRREITDPFMLFLFEQARSGVLFNNECEARAAFEQSAQSAPEQS